MSAKTLKSPFAKLLRSAGAGLVKDQLPKCQCAKSITRHRHHPDHSKPRRRPSPDARGVRPNWGFVALIVATVATDWTYLTGRVLPAHDTKYAFAFFDYLFSNEVFGQGIPHWIAYGLYGIDATIFNLWHLSGASYLAAVAGKLVGARDSLRLFWCSICLEHLNFAVGMWLLCFRLYLNTAAKIAVCLLATSTVMFYAQIEFNFRYYSLLPTVFYFMVRLAQNAEGWPGWLAGLFAVVGPLGADPYCFCLWGLIITFVGGVLFCGKWKSLASMLKPNFPNMAAFSLFALAALALGGSVYGLSKGIAFLSPGRLPDGSVTMETFCNYAYIGVGASTESLLLPAAHLPPLDPQFGMADYIGAATIVGLMLLCRNFTRDTACFVALALILILLSRGGLATKCLYYFPGMKMFRSVSYILAVLKLSLVLASGFGLDWLSARGRLWCWCIVLAVLADAAYFQNETRKVVPLRTDRICWPVEKMAFNPARGAEPSAAMANRVKLLQASSGSRYQVSEALLTQYDSLTPQHRMDLLSSNTFELLKSLKTAQQFTPLFGGKLRLVKSLDDRTGGEPLDFSVVRFDADHLGLDVHNVLPGFLVWSDSYEPNWGVQIAGKKQPLLNACGALKAVELGPGPNSVEFYYGGFRTQCSSALACISAATTAALLCCGVGLCVRRRAPL